MQTLLVLLLLFGLGNCLDENNSTEKNSIPMSNQNTFTDEKWDTLLWIIIALILLMFLIAIVTCCLIFVLLLCWKRRRQQQQQKKPKDIEQSSTVITQTPQRVIIPPSQNNNNVLLKSNDPTPLLHRQQDIPHSPITSDPEVVGFRPIQSPEFKKNAKTQNPEMPKPKRSASENPKLKKTVDAQKRTDTSSNVSSSFATSSPRSKKAKTPRQAKNGAILNIAIQTDLDTSDEEFQNRVRGNETMPGRNIPSPRTELLV